MEDPVGSGVEGVEKYHLPLAQVVFHECSLPDIYIASRKLSPFCSSQEDLLSPALSQG